SLPGTKNGNDYTVGSGDVTVTSAGYYCWYASWPGDTNYTGGPFTHDGSDECVQVTPKQSGILTQVNKAGPVVPGTELFDTATLSNTATPSNGVQGKIVFTAYKGADAKTCTTSVYTATVTVSGNGAYPSNTAPNAAFKPTDPGFYNWIAV